MYPNSPNQDQLPTVQEVVEEFLTALKIPTLADKERQAYQLEREEARKNREIIIQNAAWDKENDVYYQSLHRHNYVTWKNSQGKYMLDGGSEYFRSGEWNDSCQSLYLTNKSHVDDVVTNLLWGSYGKDGKQPLCWKPLSRLETDHLLAILQNVTFPNPSDISLLVILEVLKQRKVEIPEPYKDKVLKIHHLFKDG